ncbi:MAG: hypothetical protein QGG53_30560 [Planctomycetota bacterium]|jgi:hypothetical protein|nr:hypothetical protein [Planctomycetota bacterium]|tara:strand:- start:247 stop:423 length:177 start_codon:yes stop_codon:yes gene_type:complete
MVIRQSRDFGIAPGTVSAYLSSRTNLSTENQDNKLVKNLKDKERDADQEMAAAVFAVQ